jgi:hypothetical protein
MGRPTRPTAAGFYHVVTRAQADEQLFRDESDYLRFEQELRSVVHDSAFMATRLPSAISVYRF